MKKMRVTTQYLRHGASCDPCDECEQCRHYNELRNEVRRLRKALQGLVWAAEPMEILASQAVKTLTGNDLSRAIDNLRRWDAKYREAKDALP